MFLEKDETGKDGDDVKNSVNHGKRESLVQYDDRVLRPSHFHGLICNNVMRVYESSLTNDFLFPLSRSFLGIVFNL